MSNLSNSHETAMFSGRFHLCVTEKSASDQVGLITTLDQRLLGVSANVAYSIRTRIRTVEAVL